MTNISSLITTLSSKVTQKVASSLISRHKILAAALALLSLSACGGKEEGSAPGSAPRDNGIGVDTALQSRLKAFATAPRCQGRFGLYVYDLTAGKEVFADSADVAQPLASNMKLLCGVAALRRLGADYCFRTSLYTRGTVEGDTLHGDMMLWAGLDPMVTAPDLNDFARHLRRMGVRYVAGQSLVKLTLEDAVEAEEHWYPWDLSFSHYGLFFKGRRAVEKAWRNALSANGIHLARTPDTRLAMTSAGRKEKWHCRYRLLRSVDRVTKRMWKNSSNTQATSLLYALGNAVDSAKSTRGRDMADAGVRYLRSFLADSLGMKDSTLVVHDGCGLCTHNQLSPRAVVEVLRYGYEHKDLYAQLMRNLAVSGTDGTLLRLISDPRVRGLIHAKTGTLSHPYGISSLAGYCKGADGHDLCFALLDSQMSVLDAHVLQRKLCLAMIKN